MNGTQNPKTDNEKYIELIKRLPEFTHNYFYYGASNKAILTRLSYARDILYFFEYAANNYEYFPEKTVKELTIDDIRQITPLDIDRFLSWMDDQNLSEKTRARRKTSVSVLYNYLINTEQKLEFNPVSGAQKVEVSQSEFVIYLNRSEQEQLLNCIQSGAGLTPRQLMYHEKYKKRDLAIVFLFLDTGLRISELHSLNVRDVVIFEDSMHPENNECYVVTLRKGHKKAKTPSKVFFSDEAREYIRDYLESRELAGEKFTDNTPLFTTIDGDRLSIREIQQMLKKYVKASIGRSDISVHKLRSSFAMEFYKAQHNILVLQQRMGHKSMTATNIYARASEKEDEVRNSRNWR